MSVLTLETNKYAIKIDNFEGPLDLLCHLIDKNKVDIYDINLNDITDQYIQFLKEMEELNLEIASEFVVMASTLLYLKSKNLLPKQEESEEEITEEELIRRIIAYKKYKEASKKLRGNFEKYSNRFYKLPEDIILPKRKLEASYETNIIPNTYETIMQISKERVNQNAQNIKKIAITDTYTVASKVKEMFKVLIKNKKFVFNKLFSIKQHNKQEVVTAFSGLLEMARRSKVSTNQEEIFGDITVEKTNRKAS